MSQAGPAGAPLRREHGNDARGLLFGKDQTCIGVRSGSERGQGDYLLGRKIFKLLRQVVTVHMAPDLLALGVFFISIHNFPNERMANDIAGEEFYLLNAFNILQN